MSRPFARFLAVLLPVLVLTPATLYAAAQAPSVPALEDLVAGEWSATYLVGFRENPWPVREGGDYRGSTVLRMFHRLKIAVVGTEDPAAFEAAAARDFNVRYVELNEGEGSIAYTPSDPKFLPDQWGPQRIGAQAAWDETRGASDVVICVLDTGVDRDHPDLVGARFHPDSRDVVNNTDNPEDTFGHGTHVTGIAAASINNALGIAGMARVRFLVMRIFVSTETTPVPADFIEALDRCTDPDQNGDTSDRADVINMSFTADNLTAFQVALKDAWDAGSLLVAAAGGQEGLPHDPEPIGFPATDPHVISVHCVHQGPPPTFTLRLCQAGGVAIGPEAELSGPGEGILSLKLGGGYKLETGTSMAAPHVTGVAALMKTVDRTLSNAQIRTILNDTAEDIYDLQWPDNRCLIGKDRCFGHGLVRADLAVSQASSGGPPRVAFLQGTVFDQDTGLTISGVTVWIQGLDVSTNVFGQYGYPAASLQAGTWLVEFSHFSYETKVVTVSLQPGSNTKHEFLVSLTPGDPGF